MKSKSNECKAREVFIDALRDALDLEPLYNKGRPPTDAQRFGSTIEDPGVFGEPSSGMVSRKRAKS